MRSAVINLFIFLSSVVLSYADNPRGEVYRIWAETKTHLVLQHSHQTQEGYSGSTRFMRKSDGKVLFDKEIGYLTYVWLSPDSKYVVGFSNGLRFTEEEGFNLIVLDASGNTVHKESIRHDSRDVSGVVESVTEWVFFYAPDPEIAIKTKSGKATAISFLNYDYKRCSLPLESLAGAE